MNPDTAAASKNPSQPAASGPARSTHPGLLGWLPWFAAAGFAVLAGFFWQAYFGEKNEAIGLREQAELAAIEAKSLQQQLEAERILAARRLADRAAGAETRFIILLSPAADFKAAGVVVWTPPEQRGVLIVPRLPALPPDRTYQLWLADAQGQPESAGVFDAAPAGETRFAFKSQQQSSATPRFLVSVEPKAGSPAPTGATVLSSQ